MYPYFLKLLHYFIKICVILKVIVLLIKIQEVLRLKQFLLCLPAVFKSLLQVAKQAAKN